MIQFWERIKALLNEDFSLRWLSKETDISYNTIMSWINKDRMPPTASSVQIADLLGVTVEFLVTGKDPFTEDEDNPPTPKVIIAPNGKEIELDGKEIAVVPVLRQKVSAGNGTEWNSEMETIGTVPVLRQMLRGYSADKVGVMKAKGDSMTGVNIFNGDYVAWINGLIEDNGIYVIAIRGELFVKRVEFNPVERKVRIISENKNYPPMELEADSEVLTICGKVVGWIHCHPY